MIYHSLPRKRNLIHCIFYDHIFLLAFSPYSHTPPCTEHEDDAARPFQEAWWFMFIYSHYIRPHYRARKRCAAAFQDAQYCDLVFSVSAVYSVSVLTVCTCVYIYAYSHALQSTRMMGRSPFRKRNDIHSKKRNGIYRTPVTTRCRCRATSSPSDALTKTCYKHGTNVVQIRHKQVRAVHTTARYKQVRAADSGQLLRRLMRSQKRSLTHHCMINSNFEKAGGGEGQIEMRTRREREITAQLYACQYSTDVYLKFLCGISRQFLQWNLLPLSGRIATLGRVLQRTDTHIVTLFTLSRSLSESIRVQFIFLSFSDSSMLDSCLLTHWPFCSDWDHP